MSSDPFGLIGLVLDGQYRVDAVVGEGGFSVVYGGQHLGLGERVAIKCLKLAGALAHSNSPASMGSVLVDSFVKRFRDEGRLLYRLSQGNLSIVRCLASGTTLATTTGALVPYMVLEWLDGRSLEADLEERRARNMGGRSLSEALTLLEDVAGALQYAHSLGVVHRDLSPGNIFLAKQQGGATRTKVLDFGVAKVITDDLELGPRTQTLAQIRIFSPIYAAPEQFDSALAAAGPYTDVYALALVMTEVLTGKVVREGNSLGDLMRKALDPAFPCTPRARGVMVSTAVEMVFVRALAIDVARRPKDVATFWRELRDAAGAQDFGSTVRMEAPAAIAEELPPKTQRMESLKQTVRMSPSTHPPPPPQPPAHDLFQPAPTHPLGPPPEPSQSQVAPPPRPLPHPPFQRGAEPPPSSGTRWLVGTLVFLLVLGAGGALLRFLLW